MQVTPEKTRTVVDLPPTSGAIFAAAIMPLDVPRVLDPGCHYTIAVRVRNLSDAVWPAGSSEGDSDGIALGNHWLGAWGHVAVNDDGRTFLTHEVQPGQEIELALTVYTPSTPGDYILELDMVQEGVAWFKARGSKPARRELRIGSPMRDTQAVTEGARALGPVRAPRIVLLGMMSKMPVAGVVWQTVHYLVGLQRLGYEVFYVEAHARTPSMFMEHEQQDGAALAADFIGGVMRRFGFERNWAFHALHDDGRCFGLSESSLHELYKSAALIINLHGGTQPLPEHSATGRLVYLETDPVQLQIELYNNLPETIAFLEPHCAFFTFGENYGRAGCKLPVNDRFRFLPTRQPVVQDFWAPYGTGSPTTFTTIGNWQQQWREVEFQGEVYTWSKHSEFMKFLDLPARTGQQFELALSSYTDADRRMLNGKGWRVRDALEFSCDADRYRQYIADSRGEWTVAKDQNVRLRSGWFSDRATTYLAAGRPVVTQETGFSNILPTGEGLFGFATLDEAAAAIEAINADYPRHAAAASQLARDYFNYDVVLPPLLAAVDV
jgi:hypothetical protein